MRDIPVKLEKLIEYYEKNKDELKEHDSYINNVKEYNGYIFKNFRENGKFHNECKWLKKLNDFNFESPMFIGSFNQTIITKKIEGMSIEDDNARKHLYNIGILIAKLHSLDEKKGNTWKENINEEFIDLDADARRVMPSSLYKDNSIFLRKNIDELDNDVEVIIHKDIRPGNVLYNENKYYLLDFESMCYGDRDYDFIRMFNVFEQKEKYEYNDFKNFMDGYSSVKKYHLNIKKWKFYSKFYAFRMYTRILTGKVDRSDEFEKHLKKILEDKEEKISEWIERYDKK